jgi:A/G-specific adenine glycosylase
LRTRVSRRLLAWFERNQRELPWRSDRDPYRIWVSEVMLQQTLVATVIPYFERFVKTFPDVAKLAAADEQDVLRLWEGLGYYRRARDLHRAAGQLVSEHGGRIPNDPSALARLPGFGRYTCNAVLSQAFDRPLPILEANSQRVLSRLFARTTDPRRGEARQWLWRAAEDLLPGKRAGAFNQAVMELGALVCTPAAPKCDSCPLKGLCAARRLGIQDSIPARAVPPAVTVVRESAVVIWRDGRVLLAQRPADAGRWAGLWEFPHAPLADDESPADGARRTARELTDIRVHSTTELETVRHSITRYQITLICFESRYHSGEFRPGFYARARWIPPEELPDYPVSSPQRRLAKLLSAPCRQRRLF